jgi:N-acetylglutamate synthase-like GNAT family acetyltransferase
MLIKSPETFNEWEAYFQLRWEILRAPWGQIKGTEKDHLENDSNSIHAMATDNENNIAGVARLNLISEDLGQLRFMAIANTHQNKGIGNKLINYLESIAKERGIKKIILQARENAIQFYYKNGYQIKEKSFVLYDSIQHYLMEKEL